MSKIVVIGAGQAGAALVAKLRHLGFEGAVTLVGEETSPPYQRPPLSKAYLLGDMELPRLYLRPESFYPDHDIDLVTGTRAEAIDREAKVVRLADGRELAYDQLALTTGSVPNRLPAAIGGDLGGVYTVRTLADVDAMAHEFAEGRKVLVIGGGYIGLEAASVAAKKGMQVTIVEMAQRILQRVAAPETSSYFRELHRTHGATVLEEVGLKTLTGEGHVSGAELTDGSTIDVDFVIVGVGIRPDVALAEAAGLDIDNGIKTDEHGRTSDLAIFAAGDCASFPYKGERIRLESVGNAIDQAELVAENMIGAEKAYVAKPWFWSDQYDTKLQIAGLNTGYDRVVTRQDSETAVSYWYYRGDELVAVDAMNDPRAYMVGKRLIEAGKSPAPDAVGDTATELKALLKA
ncbi:FAD-dependent oxidoreductase [Maritimibacter sp. UBA3975]|uniref:NAD(P)/FAD-dependent oxidoreductase n=1 Tax=Maritimibacter sp. UBA3975 TaxID=1946833 RepID=UPI000C094B13|nr:FAD-dependent oxidoreductase [Maritimibacter sp. UBA3975]MAM63888.1 pyridine nucleotide-disulfide oxidoreductase [Maritimibacter sp.]|tara:strand:- start:46085 stop:47296 length:1212 start_codon:yes stop_codon:yes gene_type:complete